VRVLRVALATCAKLPDLGPDDALLRDELARRGVDARAAVWNDPARDWSAFDRVVLRSVWDYHRSLGAFLAWLDRLEAQGVALFNPAPLVRWNSSKAYLRAGAARGWNVPSTAWLERGRPVDLAGLLAERGWAEAVVKPAVSASAYGTFRVSAAAAATGASGEALGRLLEEGDVLVQPFLPEVTRDGEWSFVFLGGALSHAVRKRPAAGDFRVQREHGGSVEGVTPPAALRREAESVAALLPGPCAYARVDGVVVEDRLCLMEVELIEPELFLAHHPRAAARLADAILAGPARHATSSAAV
jgi:glutathione synthase/RimK-type ligase-like ATP-grasp enzyme